MSLTTSLLNDLETKIADKKEGIEFFKGQIIVINSEKEVYESGIDVIDNDAFGDINEVNDSLSSVKQAYQNRINVGCKTDTFWRVTGFTAGAPDSFTLTCTKMQVAAYEPIGIGSFLEVVSVATAVGIKTYPLSTFLDGAIEPKNLYGLKYYDEPRTQGIGITVVTSFIGTIAIGSSILTISSPVGSGVTEPIQVGQLITSSKTGVFPIGFSSIVGIGTTIADLSSVGLGITDAPTLTLSNLVSVGAASPETDGSFVSFTILQDPDSVSNEQYSVDFYSSPFVPQTIGIMKSNQLGIGTYVVYDHSGLPSNTQSWNPNLRGLNGVTEPQVGAGKIYYPVGFSSFPVNPLVPGVSAALGAQITVTSFTGITENFAACSAEVTNALNNAIATANAKEAAIAAGISSLNTKLEASNALRLIRDDEMNLRIYGMRQLIGSELDTIKKYEGVMEYIGLTSITSLLS